MPGGLGIQFQALKIFPPSYISTYIVYSFPEQEKSQQNIQVKKKKS